MTGLLLLPFVVVGFIAGSKIADWQASRVALREQPPQEAADELNKYSLARGCNKCGSTKCHYDIIPDQLVCLSCGARADRKWVLEHPELSDV